MALELERTGYLPEKSQKKVLGSIGKWAKISASSLYPPAGLFTGGLAINLTNTGEIPNALALISTYLLSTHLIFKGARVNNLDEKPDQTKTTSASVPFKVKFAGTTLGFFSSLTALTSGMLMGASNNVVCYADTRQYVEAGGAICPEKSYKAIAGSALLGAAVSTSLFITNRSSQGPKPPRPTSTP